METADYFRKAVQDYLKDKPRGAQSELAENAGIKRIHLNDFLGKRRVLQEKDRIKITNFLGYDYLEFLQHGKRLLEGKPEPSNEPCPIVVKTHPNKDKDFLKVDVVAEKLQSLNQDDIKIIDLLINRLSKSSAQGDPD